MRDTGCVSRDMRQACDVRASARKRDLDLVSLPVPSRIANLATRNPLPYDFSNDLAVNIGKPKIATGVTIRELGVVEPHEMQDRGM